MKHTPLILFLIITIILSGCWFNENASGNVGAGKIILTAEKPTYSIKDAPENGIDSINKIIFVDKAYGSTPDDGTDDAPAIRKAIETASVSSGWTIVFSEGEYTISPESIETANPANRDFAFGEWVRACFYLECHSGLTLLGYDTTFMLTDCLTGTFSLVGCDDITVWGITFDCVAAPWIQGTVTSVDKSYFGFTLEVDKGYTIYDDERVEKMYAELGSSKAITGNVYVETGRLKSSANDYFTATSYEKIGETTYLVTTNRSFLTPEFIDVGDRIVLNTRWGGGSVFELLHSKGDITIRECTVYAHVGCGIMATYGTGALTVDNFNILRKPGTDRMISTNADGIHVQGLLGPATITNCTFEGMMDDGINFYQYPIAISSVNSGTNIVLYHAQYTVTAGETLYFYNAETGTYKGCANVLSSEKTAGGDEITLDTQIEGLTAGTFPTGDCVYTSGLAFENSVIENNTFREYRGAGIICRANNAVIQNNSFLYISGVGIDMQNYSYTEGLGARNITIKNNLFDGIAYMGANAYGLDIRKAIININATTLNWETAGKDCYISDNITIENNEIINLNSNIAINVSNGSNIIIKNNTISALAQNKPPDYYSSFFTPEATAVFIANSMNVTVYGNIIEDMRPWLTAGIFIDDSTCVNISESENSITVTDGVPLVLRSDN